MKFSNFARILGEILIFTPNWHFFTLFTLATQAPHDKVVILRAAVERKQQHRVIAINGAIMKIIRTAPATLMAFVGMSVFSLLTSLSISPVYAATPSPTPSATPTDSLTPTPSPSASTKPPIIFTKTKMKAAAAKRPYLSVKTSSPQAIAYVQKFLKLKLTGKYTKSTIAAVKNFQTLKGIPVTGVVAKQTWAAILDAPSPLAPIPTDKLPALSKRAKYAVAAAVQHVGKKYVLGGTGPKVFDCSGLVQAAWKDAGVKLPRTSGAQFAATRRIALTDLQPGDLLFYGPSGSWHVAMYIGDDQIVEAANPKKGLVLSSHHWQWYTTNFVGAGRVITKATGPVTGPKPKPSPSQTPTPTPTPTPSPSITATPRPTASPTPSAS